MGKEIILHRKPIIRNNSSNNFSFFFIQMSAKLITPRRATQYTGVSGIAQLAGLGVAYRSENHSDFQLHFDGFAVSFRKKSLL